MVRGWILSGLFCSCTQTQSLSGREGVGALSIGFGVLPMTSRASDLDCGPSSHVVIRACGLSFGGRITGVRCGRRVCCGGRSNQTLHPTAARFRSCQRHRKFSRPIRSGRLLPAAVGELWRWMRAIRVVFPVLMALLFVTGCYTCTQAPGATGKVVDAVTHEPVRGAEVTRPSIAGGPGGRPGLPADGLPAASVATDRNGRFNLPPATHTQIASMYLHNPPSISGTFLITAPGYGTNEVGGVARSHGLWRADLGDVPLRKR